MPSPGLPRFCVGKADEPNVAAQVPTVEGLTVRVVSNVRKTGEVKSRFLETFQAAEGYPDQLPYTQKVGAGPGC